MRHPKTPSNLLIKLERARGFEPPTPTLATAKLTLWLMAL